MLKRFLPRQENFFIFFQKTADILTATAAEFHLMLCDLTNQQHHVDLIAHHEANADEVAHKTFELLHKTFITPFDRHDIHHLTTGLDDTLDLIHRCAQRFPFYHLTKAPAELIRLAEYSEQSTQFLKEAVYRLHNLNKSAEILRYCDRIDEVESNAHVIALAGEKKLFLEESNFKEFLKLKDIYADTKSVINRCQDVSNIIKGIVLEYS